VHFDKSGSSEVKKVYQFKEKPNLENAQRFVDSGDYLWNAGIFVWSARSILSSFQRHSPDIFDILSKGAQHYNSEREQDFINEHYPTTPNISVDYAILERSDNVYTLPSDIGWSDLGTWASLHEEMDKNDDGNVLQGQNIVTFDTHNSLIRAPRGKLVVTKDLDGYIVVDEGDVLLIWPKGKEQEIKAVAKVVEEQTGDSFL
jgi:mannose-1-phosphate guanylyltransferase